MKSILKKIVAGVCTVALTFSMFAGSGGVAAAQKAANILITEVYIDDIDRPQWIPTGSAVFDPMEYVEIYNPTDSDINLSRDYKLYHYRKTEDKEYLMPFLGQTGDVIIPANSCAVLWAYYSSKYSSASESQTPTISDFRSAFGIQESVPVYKIDSSSCKGFYNTYNGSMRIKSSSGSLIYEAAFTPATDSADGKSIEFRAPAEGTVMLVYGQKTAPNPGVVSEEQYTPPTIPNQPVISNIFAKDNYSGEEPFTVSADFTDTKSASLFLKQSEYTGFQQFPMKSTETGKLGVTVPRTKLWGDTVTWYIEAYNDTKTTRSEEKTSGIQYAYDPAKQPQVLMTELKTEDTKYNYIEFYNNSDHTINFSHYNVFYEYPSGLSYLRWTFATNALYIDPGKTLVVWINDDEKTVAQFNQHYGVALEENKSIIKVNYSGMSPDIERTIKLGNVYEKPVVLGTYHEDEIDDTEKTTTIDYTYSRDNGIRMVKAETKSTPTPGSVKAWQVPAQRVAFDNYGGFEDDGSTMVLRPREAIPQAIDEGIALNVAFDCYDTATGVNTIETYYRFDDEVQYRVKLEKTQRIARQLITSIPASEFLGHKKVTFYIRAYNAYRYYDTPVYSVDINPTVKTEGITLNVSDNQVVSGVIPVSAIMLNGDDEINIEIDGQPQSLVPVLHNGAYFSYKSDNLTSYYKNAVTVGGKAVKLLSSWAGVGLKGAHIDSGDFVRKADGDYEVTVTLRAGTEGSPFQEGGTYASFAMSNMALYLPDGTFIYPDNGINYSDKYTIGSSGLSLDVHFTIPEEMLKGRGFQLDTAALAEGRHVIRASAGGSTASASIISDNAGPGVDVGFEEGQKLDQGYVISPAANDGGSDIDSSKTQAVLDGRKISLPYTVSSSDIGNGTHVLNVSFTDMLGQTTQKSVTFVTDITVPDAAVNQVEQESSTSAAISVQVNGGYNAGVTVAFMEGKQFSLQNNNIQVSSGAGDNPVFDGSSGGLSSSSDRELPYQLFQIQTGELKDEDLIEADWKGSSNAPGTLQMYVLNVSENKWEPVASEDQGGIKASFKAKNHIKDGTALLLVQNRSEGSIPSTSGRNTAQSPGNGSNEGSQAWDGTGVPENYDFSFAWISDPQYYVESWPHHYPEMNQWILDNRDNYNIKYTINTGDLIDEWDREEQWKIADQAQKLFDDAGMPNGVLAGNHDVASGNEEFDSYWKYFGEDRYNKNIYYGGSYRNNLGHYDLISAGGQDFIILYMSWDCYKPEVDWMNEVLAKYPERKAIIAIHRYLKQGGTLDYTGLLVQEQVVAKNPNVFAVINGHYFGAAIKVDGFDDNGDGIKERKVYQICTDYQGAAEGGLQYIKMLYFDLENDKIYMNSYSPYLNDFNYFDNPKLSSYDIGVTASSQDIYELDVDFDTSIKTLETGGLDVGIYTNNLIGKQENMSGTVTQLWEGLSPDTQYWWCANVTNEEGAVLRTPLTSVRTAPGTLEVPVISSVIPGDSHVVIGWNPVADAEGYKVFSGTVSGIYDTELGTAGSLTNSYDATGLVNGKKYYFAVKAVSGSIERSYSREVMAQPRASAAGVPEILSAAAGDGGVKISWSPVEGAAGYKIYADTIYMSTADVNTTAMITNTTSGAIDIADGGSTSPGAIYLDNVDGAAGGHLIQYVDGATYEYNIQDLTNGTLYYLAVTAVNAYGESPLSNQAMAVPTGIPAPPDGVSAAAGSSEIVLTWNNVPGADSYKIYKSETSEVYGAASATVDGTVLSYRASGLTGGKTYYFVIRAVNEYGVSRNSNEISAVVAAVPGAPTGVSATAGNGSATISFTPPEDNGGSPITGYIATSIPGGITATGTGNTIVVTGLNNGTSYRFTVRAVNSAGSGPESVASNVVIPIGTSGNDGGTSGPGNSSGSNTSGNTKAPAAEKASVKIYVNGIEGKFASAVTEKTGGQTVTSVTVDDGKIQEIISGLNNGAKITVPFDTGDDTSILVLNAQSIKNMEAKQAVLEIKAGSMIYNVPAAMMGIDDILPQFGSNIELKDIKVKVKLSEVSGETEAMIREAAGKNNYRVITGPVEFEITCTAGSKTVEVSNFKGYVERRLAVPEGADPASITTGVVAGQDGALFHVPTTITVIDGKYYARINSLTNSTYLLIESTKSFKDVEKHWAKQAINDMGSRLIVSGTEDGNFNPGGSITRAEFAAIVVNALGLRHTDSRNNSFTDVPAQAWYHDAVSIAAAYGLMTGSGNGEFRPEDRITREQALTVIAKAMEITGLKPEANPDEYQKILAGFSDSSKVASWAVKGAASCVDTGIVSGKDAGMLAPKADITRAEACVIIRNLLQKSKLI
ncbi:S-layer homology domain-containing protein [Ruminiclostridium cellobioparum]|uniref:Metallophosphoesterase n=1 Tax=Ruminiclostridium cellobioparum subsp. termitidis CT1112 TaxID=1195236 RepID=S0FMU7_RUMCE|nr:S-layer homology domain-containing protein [Ruminiclostridium cellobioparum]EMS69818.1 metallophosphoesterase [Ruminiclostridium cellobioparum subsp. termitidis CT1112]